MTFDQYIQNPMGIKNAVISNREMYRTMYTDKLNKILVREASKVEYYLYKSKSAYYAHIKVPSEVVPKFTYDVVIKFTEPKAIVDMSLKKFDVQFYSNDPAFVYTFAHAFISNNLFIPELKDKMSKEAIRKVAKEKNPTNQVGYVKSLYFAYLIMQQRGLFSKALYVEIYNEAKLKSMIMHADKKIADRTEAGQHVNDKPKKEKPKREIPPEQSTKRTSVSNKIKTVAHTHKVGTIKKSNKIGMKKK